jgi:hypothetical protein
VRSRLELLRDGVVFGRITTTGDEPEAGLVDGDVTVDVTATIHRTFRATVIDPEAAWAPTDPDDALSVVGGNAIRVLKGFAGPEFEGGEELKPLGVFVIEEPKITDSTKGLQIELTGNDRSQLVRDNAWTRPYTVKKNQELVAAAQLIIRSRVPWIGFSGLGGNSTAFLTPYMHFDEQKDPWDAAVQLLAGAGLETFMDILGYCMIRPVPDVAILDPVWEYVEGPTSTIESIGGAVNRRDIYNGVVAVGENTYGISPARAEVWDDNGNSPTYAGTETTPGRFGRKVKFLPPNPAITTNAMAREAAAGDLRKSIRYAPGYEVTGVIHPCHEGGDLVRVAREKLGLDLYLALERFSLPLAGNALGSARLRERV